MNSIEKCTGCGACAASCNHHAISMQRDDEGFLFPKIDTKLCVKCGLCDSVCEKAQESLVFVSRESYISYALSAKERDEGSSGGIFGVLADNILQKGGVVFGAAYISKEKRVMHVSTNTISIERLKKSKYVQSDTGGTYQEVQKLCVSGIPVLYVGTPCQINGLHAYLGREYSTLLTMDFACHGVPSPKLFTDVIEHYEHESGYSVIDITFREKKFGWRSQATNTYFENGNVVTEKSSDTLYYNLFIRNYSLRKSCFFCKRYNAHASDFTVADHWRIDKDRDDDRGVSLINVNTDKGALALQETKNKLFLEPYQEKNPEFYSHANYDLHQRDAFFEYYTTNSMEMAFNKYGRIISRLNAQQKVRRLFRSFLNLPHALLYHLHKRNSDK